MKIAASKNNHATHPLVPAQAAPAFRHPLDSIFAPSSVAVIGATEKSGSVGRMVFWNLLSSPFGGTLYPVNPKRDNVLGVKAYPSLDKVPGKVDLAVIVTPAAQVPEIITECVRLGIRGAIIISAGFKEAGAAGAKLEQQVRAAAQDKIRIIGPNCLGIMRPVTGLNATFATGIAQKGSVAFLSQSGALLTGILDWSFKEHVGFSAFVSTGSMLDVSWGDLIEYFGDDPQTESIIMYMETIGDAPAFLSAAREVARSKPIIVIKAGRSEAAALAAASHTGSLAGSDEVLDAAFRRCGILRVTSIAELFNLSEILSKQPRPKGPRLTILTNAGGPGVLATDALCQAGGTLATLSKESLRALDDFLPAHWSHGNPIDVLGDSDAERLGQAMRIAAKDPNTDGMLVVLTPQAMTDPTQFAERIVQESAGLKKPLLTSLIGGECVAKGEEILNKASIPTFKYPDTAAQAFGYMWKYSANLIRLYETPSKPSIKATVSQDAAPIWELLKTAMDENRTVLTEFESKQILAHYGITPVPTFLALTAEQAVARARLLKYPVVLKLNSHVVTHKTDVGGVELNLYDDAAVRHAFARIEHAVREKMGLSQFEGVSVQSMVLTNGVELILGSSFDAQFGPVILFGSGGKLVEVLRDRALTLPPLTRTLARQLMENTRIHQALLGVRGDAPVDMNELESLLVRFSQLVVENPRIKEIDINPLLASSQGFLALDARVVLHPPMIGDDDLPRSAIRPYPIHLIGTYVSPTGETFGVRPICAEDEPAMVRFHESLSDQTVRLRYFTDLKLDERTAHERLTGVCFIDYDRELALVMERPSSAESKHREEILGKIEPIKEDICAVGRMRRIHGENAAEIYLLVADAYQKHGLGRELLRRLIEVGYEWKLQRLVARMHAESKAMIDLCRNAGFKIEDIGLNKVEAIFVF